MKKLLLISLVLNAVLLATSVSFLVRATPSVVEPASPVAAVASVAPEVEEVPLPSDLAGSDESASPAQPLSREELDAMDHQEKVAALMEIGWSSDDAKVFALGRVMRGFMERAIGAYQDGDYWKTSSGMNMSWEEQREMMKMQHRMQEVMEDLFGSEATGMFGGHSIPIPPDKARAAAMIQQDYQMMKSKLHMDAGGIMLPEDHEAIALLEKEQRRDLEAVLSPEELFEYDIRASSTAMSLRHQLRGLEPTEEEYRTIFRLKHDVEQATLGAPEGEEETQQRQEELQEQLKADLREALGEDRYRQYERSQDWGYGRLVNVARRLDLPRERVDEVYDLKEHTENQRQALRSGDLSDEERREAMETLGSEIHKDLIELLGEDGLELYQQNGGHWVRQLQ